MGIDKAHYHGWKGRLQPPLLAISAIVRVALVQVLRRKSYWFVLALGMLNFLMFFSVIYVKTQFLGNDNARVRPIFERLDFDPEPDPGKENGYVNFMDRQSLVVMILLAFSGSLLIGNDFRMGALPFYLSRRISRWHYIAGKLLAISCIIALLTGVPAMLLFIEYGMFTSSLDYFITYWKIPASIIGYTFVMCAVLSTLLLAVSSYLQRTAPVAITWASAFVLLGTLASVLTRSTGNLQWQLLDPWKNIRYVGKLCFGYTETPLEADIALHASYILMTVCTLALAASVYRVRAVEVVE